MAGYKDLRELNKITERQLRSIKNIGPKTIVEIMHFMMDNGITLKSEI
jgi:DNA-directed RNA polymerase alpha subunit